MVNDVPLPSELPPLEAAYQFKVPALAVAPSITVPVAQRSPGVVVRTVGVVFTVAVIEVREDVHPVAVAST